MCEQIWILGRSYGIFLIKRHGNMFSDFMTGKDHDKEVCDGGFWLSVPNFMQVHLRL